MKNNVFLVLFAAILALSPLGLKSVSALSCLPVDMYLKDVIGKDEIVIFTGTSKDKQDNDKYTAEVIEVDEALQGWVEDTIFVYHQKDENWGYLCNAGPKEKGSKGVYVAERTNQGKYNVYQRLELTDPLVDTLKTDIEEAEVEGGISELSSTDRMNQIITTVNDLIAEIAVLIREYIYWKTN